MTTPPPRRAGRTEDRSGAHAPPLLLVEDTPSLGMVYRSVLTSAGHRVELAATAAEGEARGDTEE